MENHIRLAERQGLLQAQSISKVQQFALRLLIYSDAKKAQEATVEAAKVALISSGTRTIESLYPTWFDGGAQAEEKTDLVEEIDQSAPLPDAANYESVRWLSPKDGEEFEDLMRLTQELMNDSVTVGGGGGTGSGWADTTEGGDWR